MSADNSVVTLASPNKYDGKPEYRVAVIGSWHWDLSDIEDDNGNCNQEIAELRKEFEKAPVFQSLVEAENYEDQLHETEIVEYGATSISLTQSFNED